MLGIIDKDGISVCNRELDCITDAAGMYQSILASADTAKQSTLTPEEELRVKLPLLLAQLSPAAHAMIRDHLDHLRELVAHVHRAEAAHANVR